VSTLPPGISKPVRIVVLGCGFGGLFAVRALRKAPVEIIVVDRTNHHLFQPLLYQVATAGLAAPAIAEPIRRELAAQKNVTVLLGEVQRVDVAARTVVLENGELLGYDRLIVATGATDSYFGHDEWRDFAPGLKTLEDAFEIRRRILLAFEHAERENDPQKRAAWLTFIVIGAGATGSAESSAASIRARRAWYWWKVRIAYCRRIPPICPNGHGNNSNGSV
jgi:NADH dehydrogenase